MITSGRVTLNNTKHDRVDTSENTCCSRKTSIACRAPVWGLSSIIFRATAFHDNRYYLHVNSQSGTPRRAHIKRGIPAARSARTSTRLSFTAVWNRAEQRDKRVVWLCGPTGVAFIVPGKYTRAYTYVHKYLRGKRRCQRVPKTSSEFRVTGASRTRNGFVGRRRFYLRTEITRSKKSRSYPRDGTVNRRVFFSCFPFVYKRAYAFSLVNCSARRRSLYLQDGSHGPEPQRIGTRILYRYCVRPTWARGWTTRYSAKARCHSLPYPEAYLEIWRLRSKNDYRPPRITK